MTYKEWLNKTCARFEITEDEVDLICVNQKDLITDVEQEVNVTIAKKALCKEFASIIPLHNLSEGGYNLSWNFQAITLWYSFTCKEIGLPDITKPTLTNKSNIW